MQLSPVSPDITAVSHTTSHTEDAVFAGSLDVANRCPHCNTNAFVDICGILLRQSWQRIVLDLEHLAWD
jgi:hypothetical protein